MSSAVESLLLSLSLAIVLCSCHAYYYRRPPRQGHSLEVIAQWRQLEYGYATAADRQQANATSNLLPETGIPIDVDVQYGSHHGGGGQQPQRIFTTIPKFVDGIPYSLATVTTRRGAKGPMLQPYPNYEWHRSNGADCEHMTSASHVAITACQQLWVLDSGIVAGVQLCAPQLLLFDLATDDLLQRYRFESGVYVPHVSLFTAPLVVVNDRPPRGECNSAMIYVADVSQPGLVVYDQQAKAAWRIENRNMYPEASLGTHTIAGERFTLMDGIFALSTDTRYLYYHPLASRSEYAVPLHVLNNAGVAQIAPVEAEFETVGKRASECAASAMDSCGNLYCVTLDPIELIVWSNRMPYDTEYFVTVPTNAALLEFVSGMKVVRNAAGIEELWMLSNRLQKVLAGTLNTDEINFRIMKLPLDNIQASAFGGCRFRSS